IVCKGLAKVKAVPQRRTRNSHRSRIEEFHPGLPRRTPVEKFDLYAELLVESFVEGYGFAGFDVRIRQILFRIQHQLSALYSCPWPQAHELLVDCSQARQAIKGRVNPAIQWDVSGPQRDFSPSHHAME